MKTAITIPWEAVVEGCPPSQAKELVLFASRRCSSRSQGPAAHYDWVSKIANVSSASSLAVGRKSGGSTLVELILVGAEAQAVATLTTDRETAVVVQSLRAPLGTSETVDSDLATDELVRTYVLRYARMDADVKAFVVPGADGGEHCDDDDGQKPMKFMRPENWGFRPVPATTTTTSLTTTASWRTSHLPKSDGSHLVNCYCSSNAVLRPPHRNPFDEPPPDRGDPLQCLPPLMHVRAALESGLCSQTYEPYAESLCYGPVLALGRCRLFGVKIADDQDFTPGPEVFGHASRRLRERLVGILESFADLDDRIERQGAYGHANLALELLEARMDAHAAYLALDEAYAAALYDASPEVPAMSRRLTQVRRLISLFDGNLQKNIPLLRLAASTYLLDNWRRLLAPAYRDCPPWWLDGCLG